MILEHLRNTNEAGLLGAIFGLVRHPHDYLICGNCDAEYYRFAPTFCKNCGYAGGAIECHTQQDLIRRMIILYGSRAYMELVEQGREKSPTKSHALTKEYSKKVYVLGRELYDAAVTPYRNLFSFGPVDEVGRKWVEENKRSARKNPHILGLFLCAMYEEIGYDYDGGGRRKKWEV